jgi:ZIP family zinc transporter
MVIAAAIGLHNFAEGLAIGVSAQAGEIGLATVLIIGSALHNATEGFGIIGPLGSVRPSWTWLLVAGLVAGGPTFIGAMVGYQITSDALALCFFALAGGAILFVTGEIWAGTRRQGHAELGLYMLGIGFLLGIATDLVVGYGVPERPAPALTSSTRRWRDADERQGRDHEHARWCGSSPGRGRSRGAVCARYLGA